MNIKNFTINDLENFSGIKAHTLRTWERRFSLLQPSRTQSNLRLYTLDELKKILNIALLKRNGYRISGLSKFHVKDLEDKVGLLSEDYDKWQKAINNLTINMYTQDPESFEWVLDELLLTWPIDILIEKIIFPFLKITRLLWIGHKLCEEHLVVTAIRKKLILAIESVGLIAKGEKTILLFLPDTKQLDLGLLFSNYFLKRRGVHVLYMGNDITIQNLKSIFHVHPPTYIFTYLQHNNHFPIKQLLDCINLYAHYAILVIGRYSLGYAAPIFSDNLIQLNFTEALDFLYSNGK